MRFYSDPKYSLYNNNIKSFAIFRDDTVNKNV